MVQPALLLASNSPRRRQMLSWLGWEYSVFPADIDESHQPGETPDTYVLRLSAAKGQAVSGQAAPGQWVLAADTVVVHRGDLLGKPASPAEAGEMLRRLRGRSHQVYSALTLSDPQGPLRVQELCVSKVPMRPFSDAEIESYIQSGDPFDKAGGYAIQHPGFNPVENFSGCVASVMGLPLCHLERALVKLGWKTRLDGDVPRSCRTNLGYNCQIYAAVQRGETVG